jgi:hypothetical protein
VRSRTLVQLLVVAIATLALCAASLRAQTATGRIFGVVLDRQSGKPVAGVLVTLAGTGLSAESDARGRFTLADVAPGNYDLAAEHLGFATQSSPVDVLAGKTIDVTIRLATRPIELRPISVTVTERARWLELQGFYDRRDNGGLAGHYITRDLIERRNTTYITEILDEVPGVSAHYLVPGKRVIRFSRHTSATLRSRDPFRNRGCEPDLYIDGRQYKQTYMPMVTDRGEWDIKVDNYDVVPPTQVEAIEVYVGAATPPQYANGCGVILIWLRR